MVEVSVVVPVYGCEACLRELHRRVSEVLTSLALTYELIFVDDRGPDGAWQTIVALADRDARSIGIKLSRMPAFPPCLV